jgi:hypothetical protein
MLPIYQGIYQRTIPSLTATLNAIFSIVIIHKEKESGFVSGSNEFTTVNTAFRYMSNKRFVKVYIIHIPSIADFGRYVKEYQIPLVALLIFEHVVDSLTYE